MKEIYVSGLELKLNDLVSVYWKKKGACILSLRPHPKFEEMFGIPGAMIGNFDGREMTIDPEKIYKVFAAS